MVGQQTSEGEDTFYKTGQTFELGPFQVDNANPITAILPVVWDVPQETPDDAAPTPDGIGEIIGNDYIVKRILGSLHIARTLAVNPTSEPIVVFNQQPIKVSAGFFVARADYQNGFNLPVIADVGNDGFSWYSTAATRAVREPFMWRRVWVLGMGIQPTAAEYNSEDPYDIGAFQQLPSHNSWGGLHQGPHIDIKSRRRVKQDERLWFSITAYQLFGGNEDTPAVGLSGHLDVRAFGQLVRPRNQGSM